MTATRLGAMIRRDVPPEDVPEMAAVLDASFDELWVVEDLPFAGGVSQLSAVLGSTASVTVGHGIAPAPFRNPAALAMEWATIARVFPGRVIGGIGHGVPAWMTSIGSSVTSPLALLEETIRSVRTLLGGRSCTMEGTYVHLDGVQLQFPPHERVPVVAGVRGPRSLELSGRVADGTVLGEGLSPQAVAEARRTIDTGRALAGSSDDHPLTVFVLVGDGEWKLDPAAWRIPTTAAGVVAREVASLAGVGVESVIFVPTSRDPMEDLGHIAGSVAEIRERSSFEADGSAAIDRGTMPDHLPN